jgi:hypothetical protein
VTSIWDTIADPVAYERREEISNRNAILIAATSAAGWTPGRGEPVWLCQSRGHLFTGCDPANCIYCGDELDG